MTVIEFPPVKYLLWCGECKSTEFEIYLNSADPYDINSFECLECGDVFIPGDSEIRKPKVEEKSFDPVEVLRGPTIDIEDTSMFGNQPLEVIAKRCVDREEWQ